MSSRLAKLSALTCLLAIALCGCFRGSEIQDGGTEIPNEVKGTLYTLEGIPAVDAEVTLFPVDYGVLARSASPLVAGSPRKARTNGSGQYTFKKVPSGQYNLLASGGGRFAFRDSIAIPGGPFDLPADTLREPGSVAGTVNLLGDEDPEGVLVQIPGTNRHAFTDSLGNFLLDSLPPGNFRVLVDVSVSGYTPLTREITVTSGVRDTLPEALQPVHPDHSGRWHLALAQAPFRGYRFHQLLVHDDKLWFTTEGGAGGNYTTTLWSSTDGVTWLKVSDSISYYSKLSVYQGKLWDIRSPEGTTNVRVATSTDGVSWTVVSASTPLPGYVNPTQSAQLSPNTAGVVFQNKLWLMGGYTQSTSQPLYIAHSSPDGVTWAAATPLEIQDSTYVNMYAFQAAFDQGVHGTNLAVFQDKLWMVGGYIGTFNVTNTFAWSSADGRTWNHGSGTLARRSGHAVVAHDNKLWVLGGGQAQVPQQQLLTSEVWNSVDGNTWNQVDVAAPFGDHVTMVAVSFKGRLWVVTTTGGVIGPQYYNAVWYYE